MFPIKEPDSRGVSLELPSKCLPPTELLQFMRGKALAGDCQVISPAEMFKNGGKIEVLCIVWEISPIEV